MLVNSINCYEEKSIKNSKLHQEWREESALNEFEAFLQANWEQRKVFYNDDNVSSKQQFITFNSHKSIRTNNYIGTIAFKGKQLNIFPKVFREDKYDEDTDDLDVNHLMTNLTRWIQYCNKFSYPFINIKSELENSNNLRELFVTLYVFYVKNSLERAPYYCYEERTNDLSVIRGKIDFKDYINNKISNALNHRFNCNYSEFNFDNSVNRIIKYTCKSIQSSVTSARTKKSLRYILTRLSEVSDKKCVPADCNGIHFSRKNDSYATIISMSKMFLLNQTSSYQIDNQSSFCFLFPTEYLFEGFIAGFINEQISSESKVRVQASEKKFIDDVRFAGESLGGLFTMKHDILVENKERGVFVLDTKYKQLTRFEGQSNTTLHNTIGREVNQNDLYQIAEYAEKRNTDKAYLLYPMYRYEEEEPEPVVLERITDSGKSINIHIVRLPFVFEEDVDNTVNMLKCTIKKIFSN